MIPMTFQELALNPVFEFNQSDKIRMVDGDVLDGKKLREIFITTIFAKFLDSGCLTDNAITNKRVFVCYNPEERSGIDTAIFIPENPILAEKGSERFIAVAGKSSLNYVIQVKEYFDYNEFRGKIETPKEFNVQKFNVGKLMSYDEIILIYIRGFCELDIEQIRKDLEQHNLGKKKIYIIGMLYQENIKDNIKYMLLDINSGEGDFVDVGNCDFFQTFPIKIKDMR